MTALIVYCIFSYVSVGMMMMIEPGKLYARIAAWLLAPIALPIRLGIIISKYS